MHGTEAYFVIGEGLLADGPDATTFRMSDLLLFAFEGRKDLPAPLG